jgi:hypothetical protein
VNNGNSLVILEVLGQCNEITRTFSPENLAKVQRSQLEDKAMKGNYLLRMSQNEFISQCGDKLLKFILEEHKKAIH